MHPFQSFIDNEAISAKLVFTSSNLSDFIIDFANKNEVNPTILLIGLASAIFVVIKSMNLSPEEEEQFAYKFEKTFEMFWADYNKEFPNPKE